MILPVHATSPSLQEYTAFHGMLCTPTTARRCIASFSKGAAVFADQQEYYCGDNDADADTDTDEDNNNNTTITNLARWDFNRTASPLALNVWTYYVLVVFSMTGLSSLFGRTHCLKAVEYNNDGNTTLLFRKEGTTTTAAAINCGVNSIALTNTLRLPSCAIHYVINRALSLGPMDTTASESITTATSSSSASACHYKPAEKGTLRLVRRFEYEFGGGGSKSSTTNGGAAAAPALSVMMIHFVCQYGRLHLVEVFRIDESTVLGYLGKVCIRPLYWIKSIVTTRTKTKQQ